MPSMYNCMYHSDFRIPRSLQIAAESCIKIHPLISDCCVFQVLCWNPSWKRVKGQAREDHLIFQDRKGCSKKSINVNPHVSSLLRNVIDLGWNIIGKWAPYAGSGYLFFSVHLRDLNVGIVLVSYKVLRIKMWWEEDLKSPYDLWDLFNICSLSNTVFHWHAQADSCQFVMYFTHADVVRL